MFRLELFLRHLQSSSGLIIRIFAIAIGLSLYARLSPISFQQLVCSMMAWRSRLTRNKGALSFLVALALQVSTCECVRFLVGPDFCHH
jgi:hypothetical protein